MRVHYILMALMALAPLAGSQQRPVWEDGPSLLTPRMYHCAATTADAIYVFGGINDHREPLGSVEILRVGSESWEEGPDLPKPLYNAAVVSIGRQLLIIGGSDDDRISTNQTLIFDPHRGLYSRGPELPQPRAGMAAAVEGQSTVLVMGGVSNRGMPETTGFRLFFEPEMRWSSDVPTMNSRRINFGLVWNGAVFAVGGIHYGPVNSIETLTRNGWQNLSRLQTPRGELGVVANIRAIICVGGRDREGRPLDNVDSFEIDQRAWFDLPPLQRPRAGLTTVFFDNSIYAIGGITSPQFREAVLNTVEILRLSPDTVAAPLIVDPSLPVMTPLLCYPNPTNGSVIVNLPGFQNGRIRLFDPLGRKVMDQAITGAKGVWSWDTTPLPTGDYLLIVVDESHGNAAQSRLTVLK